MATTIELEVRLRPVSWEIRTRGPATASDTDIEIRVRTPSIQVRN